MAPTPSKLVTALANGLQAQGLISQPHVGKGQTAPPLENVLASHSQLPELSTFAGYLGGTIQYDGDDWRVLYLDWKLWSWLCVRDADILLHHLVDDDTSPFGERDVIWVSADASVGRGSGTQSTQERFLRGTFTGAGDFAASVSGGTYSSATGIFCEAQTPGCCGKHTN
jgi:hypothetical protein